MFQMTIEKVREAVRLRLEQIHVEEIEYQQLLSKIVIPFSEIFKKSELNLNTNDIPFSEWDKKYKKILLKEL